VLIVEDLFSDAVQQNWFPNLVESAFGSASKIGIGDCVSEVRAVFAPKKENERRTLTDVDLLVLIASAAMIADGFDYPNAQNHLYRVRRSTCLFIDEVQDFTEIEVFLMGMTASKKYHQITVSGDLCQRLQWNGSKTFDDLFPFVPKSSQNTPVFLKRNFRQRDALAQLSAGFRRVLQGDNRLDLVGDPRPPPSYTPLLHVTR
jgi:hypothetical protein